MAVELGLVRSSTGILAHRSAQSGTESSCRLKPVCYNAETTSNKLSRKGLSVIRTFSLRISRLICAFVACVTVVLPSSEAAAAQKTSTASKSTTTAKPAAKTTAKTTTTAKAPAKTTSAAKAPAKKSTKTVTTKRRTSTAASRRAKLARAKAAAQAKQLAEVAEPKFKTDENGEEVPDPRAEAAIVYNPDNGAVLYESNAQNQRSIASITKVMTAVVFMEDDPDLERQVVVDRSDVRAASTTYLKAGAKVTTGDLLHLTLIASDNAAARALARVHPLGMPGFIARMNTKAQEMGLSSTKYVDPSGLYAANVSSAYDMARLITYVSNDDRIASVMRMQYYSLPVGRKTVQVHSTNQLVMKGDVDVQAGKTGFIRNSGYCLATLLKLPQGGPSVAVVILGAKSNAGRFMETRHLFSWVASKASELLGGTPLQAATVPAS
jgi:D-alanyl-D-alanine endopeptidase (penicillin-binding protein 7)